jgi:hypothetical protein
LIGNFEFHKSLGYHSGAFLLVNMPSIDPLLSRTPMAAYNCLGFVAEAWEHLVGGLDVMERLHALNAGIHAENGHVVLSTVRGFRKLAKPESPCFVVMQRNKTQPHIGVFYNGRILHMKENGVEYRPLQVAQRYFTKIGFYANAK